LTVKWQMTLRARLDFHEFPFDAQTLELSLKSMTCRTFDQSVSSELSAKGKEVALAHPVWRGKKGHMIGEKADYLQEFHILHLAAKPYTQAVKAKKAKKDGEPVVLDEYTLEISAKRDSSSVMSNVVFCMFVIDCLTFTAHGIPIADLGDRLGVNLTLLLTTMAFKWYLNDALPNIPYLTVMEKYVVASFSQFLVQGIFFWILAEASNYRCADGGKYLDYLSGEERLFSNGTDTRLITCTGVHYADRLVLLLLMIILVAKNGWFLWKYEWVTKAKMAKIREKGSQVNTPEDNFKVLDDLPEFKTFPVTCPNKRLSTAVGVAPAGATVSSKYEASPAAEGTYHNE